MENRLLFNDFSISQDAQNILKRILEKSSHHCWIQISDHRLLPHYKHPILSFNDTGYIDLLGAWGSWPEKIRERLKPFILDIFMLRKVWEEPRYENTEDVHVTVGTFVPMYTSSINVTFKN